MTDSISVSILIGGRRLRASRDWGILRLLGGLGLRMEVRRHRELWGRAWRGGIPFLEGGSAFS